MVMVGGFCEFGFDTRKSFYFSVMATPRWTFDRNDDALRRCCGGASRCCGVSSVKALCWQGGTEGRSGALFRDGAIPFFFSTSTRRSNDEVQAWRRDVDVASRFNGGGR